MRHPVRWLIATLALLLFVLPVAGTTAFLTAEATTPQTQSGTGRWCAVPAPENRSNVYRLADFPHYSGQNTRMVIIPAVHNGDFGPVNGSGTLGVRLWACHASSLPATGQVKVTAWRNDGSDGTPQWLSRDGTGAAQHRLDPNNGFGAEIRELHRTGSNPGGGANVISQDRSRYSWLLSSGRTRSTPTAFPSCATILCIIDIDPHPSLPNAFVPDSATGRPHNNSVTYLGAKYWSGGGNFTPGERYPLTMQPYTGPAPPWADGGGPLSQDGRQVQWVVIEAWGVSTTPQDLVVEVFIE